MLPLLELLRNAPHARRHVSQDPPLLLVKVNLLLGTSLELVLGLKVTVESEFRFFRFLLYIEIRSCVRLGLVLVVCAANTASIHFHLQALQFKNKYKISILFLDQDFLLFPMVHLFLL
jgi:hypothetical protein